MVDSGFPIVGDPKTVADPGFPRGGGANSKGGCEKLLFGRFSPKTAWNLNPRRGQFLNTIVFDNVKFLRNTAIIVSNIFIKMFEN